MPVPIKPGRWAAVALVAGLPCLSPAATPWPTPQAIERARDAHPFLDAERLHRVPLPALPKITPTTPSPDIADIARRHLQLKGETETEAVAPSLRVLVSLSMPAASLRLLVEQAERAGAILTLRGLKAHSMTQTLTAVQALIGNRRVHWQIDPEAYTRYNVQQVPTFVLTPGGVTGNNNPSGCGEQCTTSAYYSVAGDVSLDYALDTLVRRHPDAKQPAAPFLQRLRATP